MVNGHGTQIRGADVLVDRALSSAPSSSFTVIANSAQAAQGGAYEGSHGLGSRVRVKIEGGAFVELRDLGPSEVLVLTSRP